MAEINEINTNKKMKKTENIIEYRKEYYKANKTRILQNMSKGIFCECCNCHSSKQALNKHNKSIKHIRNKELFDLKKSLK